MSNKYRRFAYFISSSLCGLLGSVLFLTAYNLKYHKTFAVVKMERILSHHLEKYGKENMSNDERTGQTKLFSRKLKKIIKKIELEDRVILLVDGAVITALPDYTDFVIKKLDGVFNNEK